MSRLPPALLAFVALWACSLPQPRAPATTPNADPPPGREGSGEGARDAPGELPPGVAARCGPDLVITLERYGQHLIEVSGRARLEELVYAELLGREADRLGLPANEAAIEAAVDMRWSALLESRHRGDPAALEEELRREGFDGPSLRRVLGFQLRQEALEERIVQATRRITEADLKAAFQALYGADAWHVRVRHLLLTRARTRADLLAAGEDPADLTSQRIDAEMAARMEQLKRRVEAGEDFIGLAQALSEDPSSRGRGGEIEAYDPSTYGPEFRAAVLRAEPGRVQGPQSSPAGLHLFEVLERNPARFESLRDELLRTLERRPADPGERFELRQRLFAAHPLEMF